MKEVETKRYVLKLLNEDGWHQITDKANNLQGHIDKSYENLFILIDAHDINVALFDNICRDIIRGEGTAIVKDNEKAIEKQEQFMRACEDGNLGIASELIKDELVNPSLDDNHAIQVAAKNGRIDIVKLLLADSRVDPSHEESIIIMNSIPEVNFNNGNIDIIKLLLDDGRVDPSSYYNSAIRKAAEHGYTAVIKLLLTDPRVNPSHCHNITLRWAALHGHKGAVELLLSDPRVDPTDNDNAALYAAVKFNNTEVVELLLSDPRVGYTR